MENIVTRLPLDFDALELGSIIPTPVLERFTKLSSDHKQFSLRCWPLRKQIEDYFRDRKGQDVCVVYRKDTLVILKDSEASDYTHQELKSSVRRMNRMLRKSLAVDTSKLTPIEKSEHERRTLAWVKVVSVTNATRKEAFRIPPATRSTPHLFTQKPKD